MSAAFESVFGRPRATLARDPFAWVDAVHEQDRARVRTALDARRAAEPEPLAEFRIVRPDGEVRWLRSSIRRSADTPGGSSWIEIALDVTDRREIERALRERTEQLERSLREKDVLLAEIHHRVKNNLQTISGLMHLMMARAEGRSIQQLVQDLERRLQTIALVHETLYRSSSLEAVDMQAYLDRLVQAHLSAPDSVGRAIQIRVRAPGLTLDLDRAVHCGLIVNELMNNSLKHAFTGRKRGRIAITLEHAAGDRLVLRVADNGVGLPAELDFTSEATLGLRLVRGLAEQLGGSARRVPDVASAIDVVFPAGTGEPPLRSPRG